MASIEQRSRALLRAQGPVTRSAFRTSRQVSTLRAQLENLRISFEVLQHLQPRMNFKIGGVWDRIWNVTIDGRPFRLFDDV